MKISVSILVVPIVIIGSYLSFVACDADENENGLCTDEDTQLCEDSYHSCLEALDIYSSTYYSDAAECLESHCECLMEAGCDESVYDCDS